MWQPAELGRGATAFVLAEASIFSNGLRLDRKHRDHREYLRPDRVRALRRVLTLVCRDVTRGIVSIEPIEVPRALSRQRLYAQCGWYRLRDALKRTPTRQLPCGDNGTNFNSALGFITADDANLNSIWI
jgi:hypothetical protein